MRVEKTGRRRDSATREHCDAERRKKGRLSKFSRLSLFGLITLLLASIAGGACTLKASRSGVPPEIDSVIEAISDDIANGRYQKIYDEAADEWRNDSTLEQSTGVFDTSKAKLGKVDSRVLHSATEEHSSALGHSFVVSYRTRFERAEGMETFTLVERNGHWLLARYFVNSTALG